MLLRNVFVVTLMVIGQRLHPFIYLLPHAQNPFIYLLPHAQNSFIYLLPHARNQTMLQQEAFTLLLVHMW